MLLLKARPLNLRYGVFKFWTKVASPNGAFFNVCLPRGICCLLKWPVCKYSTFHKTHNQVDPYGNTLLPCVSICYVPSLSVPTRHQRCRLGAPATITSPCNFRVGKRLPWVRCRGAIKCVTYVFYTELREWIRMRCGHFWLVRWAVAGIDITTSLSNSDRSFRSEVGVFFPSFSL